MKLPRSQTKRSKERNSMEHFAKNLNFYSIYFFHFLAKRRKISKVVKLSKSYSNGHKPYHCSLYYLACALHAWRSVWILCAVRMRWNDKRERPSLDLFTNSKQVHISPRRWCIPNFFLWSLRWSYTQKGMYGYQQFCLKLDGGLLSANVLIEGLGLARIFNIKCLSKQPERWSCWYTLDQ